MLLHFWFSAAGPTEAEACDGLINPRGARAIFAQILCKMLDWTEPNTNWFDVMRKQVI